MIIKSFGGDIIVSNIDYEHLNTFTWSITNTGYAQKKYGPEYSIHKYIIKILMKLDIDNNQVIDHINKNKLDNTRENLRVVTRSENSRNKPKKENSSSEYIGVSKYGKKWRAAIYINNKPYSVNYDNEIHAAYQYNLWLEEFNLNMDTKNNIELPKNFIKYEPKKNKLPKYIRSRGKKFRIIINKKCYGTYNTINEAVIKRDEIIKQIPEKIVLPKEIKRNINNQAIIEIFNKNKEKVKETIIDDNLHEHLTSVCSWSLTSNKKYIKGTIKGRTISLHRYIMEYMGKFDNCNIIINVIHHINNNSLDNRIENLVITNHQINSLNMKSNKNATSKYIGVYYDKKNKKWRVMIGKKNIGSFTTEEEAHNARKEAEKEFFDENFQPI